MEIRTMITFQKIAELGSFSQAATALGYSQSTVTMQIKQLELELGVRLFNRIGRKITITNEGLVFLKHASIIIRESQNALNELSHEKAPAGELRIGILESICTAHLPNILSRYHALYPQVTTIIQIGTYAELSNMLNTDQIDVLWIFDHLVESPSWISIFNYESEISIVSASSNPLASRIGLTLAELANTPFLLTESDCSYRADFLNHLSQSGIKPHVFLEIGSTDIIKKFTEADLGIALLPKYTISKELSVGKLSLLQVSDYHLTMYGQIFHHKNKWTSPSLTCFARLVQESIPSSNI